MARICRKYCSGCCDTDWGSWRELYWVVCFNLWSRFFDDSSRYTEFLTNALFAFAGDAVKRVWLGDVELPSWLSVLRGVDRIFENSRTFSLHTQYSRLLVCVTVSKMGCSASALVLVEHHPAFHLYNQKSHCCIPNAIATSARLYAQLCSGWFRCCFVICLFVNSVFQFSFSFFFKKKRECDNDQSIRYCTAVDRRVGASFAFQTAG